MNPSKSLVVILIVVIYYRWFFRFNLRRNQRSSHRCRYITGKFFRYLILMISATSLLLPMSNVFASRSTRIVLMYLCVSGDVCNETNMQIERESEGGKTDLALAKQVLSIFEEIGGDALENYEKDIGEAMVEASGKFYSRKALDWMATMSYDEYMLKVINSSISYRVSISLFRFITRTQQHIRCSESNY